MPYANVLPTAIESQLSRMIDSLTGTMIVSVFIWPVIGKEIEPRQQWVSE